VATGARTAELPLVIVLVAVDAVLVPVLEGDAFGRCRRVDQAGCSRRTVEFGMAVDARDRAMRPVQWVTEPAVFLDVDQGRTETLEIMASGADALAAERVRRGVLPVVGIHVASQTGGRANLEEHPRGACGAGRGS
jgi:hypothetical protein